MASEQEVGSSEECRFGGRRQFQAAAATDTFSSLVTGPSASVRPGASAAPHTCCLTEATPRGRQSVALLVAAAAAAGNLLVPPAAFAELCRLRRSWVCLWTS